MPGPGPEVLVPLLLEHAVLGVVDVRSLCEAFEESSNSFWIALNADHGLKSHSLLRAAARDFPAEQQQELESAMQWLVQHAHNMFGASNPYKAETSEVLVRADLPDGLVSWFIHAPASVKLSNDMILGAASVRPVDAEEIEKAREYVRHLQHWVQEFRRENVSSGLSASVESICIQDEEVPEDNALTGNQLVLMYTAFRQEGGLEHHLAKLDAGQVAHVLLAIVVFQPEQESNEIMHWIDCLYIGQKMGHQRQDVTGDMLTPVVLAAMQAPGVGVSTFRVLLYCWPEAFQGLGLGVVEDIISYVITAAEEMHIRGYDALAEAAARLPADRIAVLLAAAVDAEAARPTMMLPGLPQAAQIPEAVVADLLAAADLVWGPWNGEGADVTGMARLHELARQHGEL